MSALAGIRIVDITANWAGPITTDLLAVMGAEVIKVESRRHLDSTRLSRNATDKKYEGPNRHLTFLEVNLSKLSITLDLHQPAGLELAKSLINIIHAFVDNFFPGES